MAAVVACLSGCAASAAPAAPAASVRSAVPGKLGGYDPARNGSADVEAALAAGSKDGRNVLTLFGSNDNADCRALALLSGDPAVAPLVADYHVVTIDVGDPGPNLRSNRAMASRMFLDLGTSGVPAVIVTKPAGNTAQDLFSSNDESFAHARSMTAAQLAAFLNKWR
jgi:thioredoxin 1